MLVEIGNPADVVLRPENPELGKTVEDTAKIEDVKYNTVRIALAEARRRYDLCNNTQLVAQAIRRGLI